MHPQAFLQTFWRMELRPQVFVAMDFNDRYKPRFDDIIAPAIAGIRHNGVWLKPYRVDLSKSGDSILMDIIEGVAHSQMVVADVSSIGKDTVTGEAYRNANVMYEVGLALACRQSTEVLLVRDDEDKFLFDVSTIPHMKIDFTDTEEAKGALQAELVERLKARDHVNDARVHLAIASLSREEVEWLKQIADYAPGTAWGRPNDGTVDFSGMASLPRLLDKQVINVVGQFEEGHPAYALTPLGLIVAKLVKSSLRQLKADEKGEQAEGTEAPDQPKA